MEKHIGFVAVQPRNGTVTIPAQVRREFGLDKPGAQVEILIRDGEIVLVPHVAVPADQAWFWTPAQQQAEREADADAAAGRFTELESSADLLTHLDKLAGDREDDE